MLKYNMDSDLWDELKALSDFGIIGEGYFLSQFRYDAGCL